MSYMRSSLPLIGAALIAGLVSIIVFATPALAEEAAGAGVSQEVPDLFQADVGGTNVATAIGTAGLGTSSPVSIVIAIISAILGILALVAIGLMIYAGFTWMTAGGQQDKVQTAMSTMKNAFIGLLLIMSAYGVTAFIVGIIEDSTGYKQAALDLLQMWV